MGWEWLKVGIYHTKYENEDAFQHHALERHWLWLTYDKYDETKHEYASLSQLDESPTLVLNYKQKDSSIEICLVRIHSYTFEVYHK